MAREARSQRIEAIVLKHSDFGEADRLLTLYSREQGKLSALAKGARKPGSRKGGHLEPFSQVRLLLGKGRELAVVSQAEAVETNSETDRPEARILPFSEAMSCASINL